MTKSVLLLGLVLGVLSCNPWPAISQEGYAIDFFSLEHAYSFDREFSCAFVVRNLTDEPLELWFANHPWFRLLLHDALGDTVLLWDESVFTAPDSLYFAPRETRVFPRRIPLLNVHWEPLAPGVYLAQAGFSERPDIHVRKWVCVQ